MERSPNSQCCLLYTAQQRSKSASFPQGTSWHDVQLDNQQYIDHALPGRIEHRGREVVKVMLPLVKELAKVEKKS